MSKKLIYPASFCLTLILTAGGWPKATNPNPEDGVIFEGTWASLVWEPSDNAASFDVYLGENYDDVDRGTGDTFRGNQRTTTFIIGFMGFPYPQGLVPGTTYYWRIDEVNDLHPDSPWRGDIWSFTIPSYTAYNPDPPDGAEFVAPDVTLSWQPGFRTKLHTVYFGEGFDEVNTASDGVVAARASYNPGRLEIGKTYYWRVDEYEPPDTHKGDVWSFTVGAAAPGGPVTRIFYVDTFNGNDGNNGLAPHLAFATIMKGIDAAADGDVVLVYPGLYDGEVDFLGKAIIVQGIVAGGAGVPVIRNTDDFAVSFYSGEGPDSILQNFIIRDSFMGVFIAASSPTLSNLTIVGNRYGIEAYAGSEPVISNSILWYNTNGDLFGCRARYSCVERGSGEDITADPLFVDPDNGDYHLRSERGRYWPQYDLWVLDKVTSPCIDGGDPQIEASEEPMPNGGRINIGAYGSTPEASLSPRQSSPLPGRASNPSPADGAVEVEREIMLRWTAGSNAVSHDVYFGTSEPLSFIGNLSATYFNPGKLNPGTTYLWRIDEFNNAGTTTGEVWTFTVGTHFVPPTKGRACFVADTPVLVDGKLMQISNVVAGQAIEWPCCGRLGHRLEHIEKVEEHEGTFVCRDIVLANGNRISVVDAHCFMLDSGRWIAAQDLRSGMRLRTLRGTVGIRSVETRTAPFVGKVYNLKIENSDKYAVGKDAVIVRDY